MKLCLNPGVLLLIPGKSTAIVPGKDEAVWPYRKDTVVAGKRGYLSDLSFEPGPAGPIRNRKIIEASDKLAAFWDGKSRALNYIFRKYRMCEAGVFLSD